jgi:hypothetical protein
MVNQQVAVEKKVKVKHVNVHMILKIIQNVEHL